MTFPTAEDIIHVEDELIILVSWDKTQAESLKQQILSEHEIVERLKKELYKLENPKWTLNDGNIDQFNSWAISLLKSILENKHDTE